MKTTHIGTDVREAARLLKSGALVAIPTETVYGLAANAFDLTAVADIFRAKNRPFFDPLILHVASVQKALDLFDHYPPLLSELAHTFWPGPLTLVAPKKTIVPDLITAGSALVAVRVPAHPLSLDLLSQLDFPLAAPSANPFGYVSPTTAQHVLDQLAGEIDYILDGGACQNGIESTIIGFSETEPQLWRLGSLTVESIESKLGCKLLHHLHNNSNPQAPGQLDKHYAPNTQLRLLSKEQIQSALSQISEESLAKIAFLAFGNSDLIPSFSNVFHLSPNGELPEAAHHLYALIRRVDTLGFEEMWIQKFETEGLGAALNDRLKRAAVL